VYAYIFQKCVVDFIDGQGYEESDGMRWSISKNLVGENEIKRLFMPSTISFTTLKFWKDGTYNLKFLSCVF